MPGLEQGFRSQIRGREDRLGVDILNAAKQKWELECRDRFGGRRKRQAAGAHAPTISLPPTGNSYIRAHAPAVHTVPTFSVDAADVEDGLASLMILARSSGSESERSSTGLEWSGSTGTSFSAGSGDAGLLCSVPTPHIAQTSTDMAA